MLITRETDYALRILRALAPGSCLTVGEIAEKESLPHKFTYKIMKKLEKACMTADYQCEWRDKNGSPCNVHGQLAKVQLAIDREFRSRSLYWVLFGD